MTWRLRIRSHARLDVAEASDRYDEQKPGLGADFLHAIESKLAGIQDNPFQYQLFRGDLRRVNLQPYPYTLVYAVLDEEVVILRCMHS